MDHRAIHRSVVALIFLFMAGCSAGSGSLSGKVTYQEKTVIYGTVMAICSDGITRSANIAADGTYRIDNLPTGAVKLGVVSPEPPDPTVMSGRQSGRGGGAEPPAPQSVDRSKWFRIPDEFGDPRTSGQETQISVGANTFHIRLP
jgi:hypothetical protein